MSAVPPPAPALDPEVAALLRRDPDGLVAAVVQQHDTGEVLMLGLDGRRGAAPHADHRPGHLLVAQPAGVLGQGRDVGPPPVGRAVALDCDGDALLVSVDQVGAACHTGDRTCFHRRAAGGRGSAA